MESRGCTGGNRRQIDRRRGFSFGGSSAFWSVGVHGKRCGKSSFRSPSHAGLRGSVLSRIELVLKRRCASALLLNPSTCSLAGPRPARRYRYAHNGCPGRLRLQLEHLTLQGHLATSPIENNRNVHQPPPNSVGPPTTGAEEVLVRWSRDAEEADVAHAGVDHLRTPRRRPIAHAVAVGAEERASLDDLARDTELRRAVVVEDAPAGPSRSAS
jgi:hypothetical protein